MDDIRGFQTAFVNGVQQAVSTANPLTVTIGADMYTLIGAVVDATNVSTAPGGVSGVLTLSGNVTVSDATAGNTVQAATASLILRPNGADEYRADQAADTLSMTQRA